MRITEISAAGQADNEPKLRDKTDDRQGIGIRSCWLKGRDDSAMTEDDTGWSDPPDPEVAQPQDGLAGQPRIGELELDADGLPIQNRPATGPTYLSATACLAGSLVSVGLAVTEIAEYVNHNRVGNLAILGMVIGLLAGVAAMAVNDEKPPGWAYRINTVAAGLALISVSSLLVLYGGQHEWM
jgi:hypothetical protein